MVRRYWRHATTKITNTAKNEIHDEWLMGGHLRPTDHSMWSELVDATGVIRAEVFYKAAFYDRRASMRGAE